MGETKHTPGLDVSARIEDRGSTHAQVGVFQNGGKAGILIVDAKYADEVVGLLNAATDLLAACKLCERIITEIKEVPKGWESGANRQNLIFARYDLLAAIASAEGPRKAVQS